MKTLILILTIVFLYGCSNVHVNKNGEEWDVKYTAWLRNLQDLRVRVDKTEGVTVILGSATTDEQLGEIIEGLSSGRMAIVTKPEK
jgi:hypothetical protein